MHISVDIRQLPGFRKLAADYAFHFSSLAPFYTGDPASDESWQTTIARAQRHARARSELAALLGRQLAAREAPTAAREAAERFADPNTVAVVTGQQAGLFGGPLYTLYKAVTAITLAAKISSDHGVRAVPVFWVESEDHDWDEVASASVFDAEFQRKTISLPTPAGAGETPVGRIFLGGEIHAAIEQLIASLPPTEFTTQLADRLRHAYRPGVTMADAFARWLEQLLGERGLVLFDCSDPAAKPLVAPLFARELEEPARTWELAALAGQKLSALGYHAQVDATMPQGPALFRLNSKRTPILQAEAPALCAEARQHPEKFSPNVLLRPVVQDRLFPTIAYVSGPNELAYLGQLRNVYERFDVPMPIVFPRASATIMDSAGARFLSKSDLPFEALHARDESALNRVLAAALPERVDRALKDADDAVAQAMAAVIAALPAIDPTLEGAAKSTLGKLQHDLSTLHGKVISAAKKRDETLRRQFHRTQAQAFPDGIPQERAVAIVSLLNRYGNALVQRVIEELPLDLGRHWVLTL